MMRAGWWESRDRKRVHRVMRISDSTFPWHDGMMGWYVDGKYVEPESSYDLVLYLGDGERPVWPEGGER